MPDRFPLPIFGRIQQYKWLVAILTLVIIASAIIGLKFISLNNNIESILPGNEEVYRTLSFLRESNLSNTVIISLKMESPDYSIQKLIEATDRLKEALGPPMITEVLTGPNEADLIEKMDSFLDYIPQLIDKPALDLIEKKITVEGIQKSLAQNYLQLLSPSSMFIKSHLQADPLGLRTDIFRSFQRLFSSLGYEVSIEDGHFISQDGQHTMLILKTPVNLTDGFGSRNLSAYLSTKLKELPSYISADIMAGHLHTISNEDVIKRDVKVMTIISAIAFLLLFLFFFRDLRAVMVFLLPIASVLVSINLASWLLKELSYLVIGMFAVVNGIVIDYGIYIYTTLRTGGNCLARLKQVAKPTITGALTTLAVFATFFFSHVSGYHQLAFFTVFSILLCLICALFVLPLFLQGGEPQNRFFQTTGQSSGWIDRPGWDKTRVTCWIIVMVIALILSCQISFSTDINQFDGSESKVLQTEQEFYRVWGEPNKSAILVAQGKTQEEALQANDHLYREAEAAIGEDNFLSFSMIWPSRQTREKNAKGWANFWKQGQEQKLKDLLSLHGEKYHFSPEAFSPFFERLYTGLEVKDEPMEIGFFEKIKERFILKKQNGYQILSFFPDTDQFISALTKISRRYPGTFLVSRKALSKTLSESIFSELVYLSIIAASLIIILTLILLGNIRLTVLALVPTLTGIVVALGIIPLMGLSLNAVMVIAAMIVAGLTSDYGIFMVYYSHYEVKAGTCTAVFLCAATTLIGAGALLLARHPVLFSIGLTLTAGVLSGYLTSVIVVPSMYRLWGQRFGRRGNLND